MQSQGRQGLKYVQSMEQYEGQRCLRKSYFGNSGWVGNCFIKNLLISYFLPGSLQEGGVLWYSGTLLPPHSSSSPPSH